MIYHEGGKIFPISDLKDENDCQFVIDALPPKKINEFNLGKLCGRKSTKSLIEFDRLDPKTKECAENLVPCTKKAYKLYPDTTVCLEKGKEDEVCPICIIRSLINTDSKEPLTKY